MTETVFYEEVRCRSDMGSVGLALRNFPVFHDILCANEPNKATSNDGRDALIENLVLSGVMTTMQVAEACGFSRQRVHQIMQRMSPRG